MGFDLYIKLELSGVSADLGNSKIEIEIAGLTEDKSGEAENVGFRMIKSQGINEESKIKEIIGYKNMCKPLCDKLRELLI